jgi:hypothetical protein
MTIAEVLLQSGWTQAQIDALDAKALSGLNGYVTSVQTAAEQKEKAAVEAAAKAEADRKAAEDSAAAAQAAKDAAELANRNVTDFWNNTYNPGVAAWEKERNDLAKKAADAAAEAAFYKAQREGYLGTLGIKPEDAPTFTPPNTPAVDPNKTPGTPTFVDPQVVISRVGDGMNTINDIMYKHQVLYGKPLPIPPSQLIAQADALKLSPMEYATRTFKFAEREQEQRLAAAKAHDDEIAAKAVAEKDEAHKAELKKLQDEFNAKEKLRAEQGGNNPDTKLPPGSAKFTDLKRAVAQGERPDPTKMSQQERRQLTLNNIHKAVEEREAVVA